MNDGKLMRRVAGAHDIRTDGILDLTIRCRGKSLLDVGCNRGAVAFEFANQGIRMVHGCDLYEPGILLAREMFTDLRNCPSRFEVVDLSKGAEALAIFGGMSYDIVLLLATYHKLRRQMKPDLLGALIRKLGNLTAHYFAWRSVSNDDGGAAEIEMKELDADLFKVGLKRVHTSYISDLGTAAIWEKFP